MSIEDSAGSIVTMRSVLFGSVMENVLLYYSVDPAEQMPPEDVADYFEDTVLDLWKACVATACQIVSVKVETTAPGSFTPYPTYIRPFVGQAGGVSGDALPPYVAARLIKVPDVANQDTPGPATPWRLGSVRIGGLAESENATGGFLAAGITSAFDNLGEALEGFTVGSVEQQLYMRRFTAGDDTPDFFVPVLEVSTGSLLTTQNTRKLTY